MKAEVKESVETGNITRAAHNGDVAALEQFLIDNSNVARFPWVLEVCNEREVQIRDYNGTVVFYEDLAMPDEIPSGRAEKIVWEVHTRSKMLVSLTELLSELSSR